jgi:hypothetical protein
VLVNVAGKGHEEEFEDTKEVIRIFISKRNRQHYAYGQKKKYKIKGHVSPIASFSPRKNGYIVGFPPGRMAI